MRNQDPVVFTHHDEGILLEVAAALEEMYKNTGVKVSLETD